MSSASWSVTTEWGVYQRWRWRSPRFLECSLPGVAFPAQLETGTNGQVSQNCNGQLSSIVLQSALLPRIGG